MPLTIDGIIKFFSDAPAIEGILAAHHFHVHNCATVAYPLSKDLPATGTYEKETDEVGASEMDKEVADEAFNITVKDWCIVIYDGELYPVKFSHSKELAMRFPPWLNLEGTGKFQRRRTKSSTQGIKLNKNWQSIFLSMQEGFTNSLISQSGS